MILILRSLAAGLNVIPGWIWAILLALALGTAAVERHQVSTARQALATEKAERNRETVQRQAVAIQAEQANRAIETERVNHVAQIVAVVESEKGRTRAALAGSAADNQRLRDQLAAFAAGRGQATGDPAAAGSTEDRAAALGRLLATCRAEAAGDAGELEDLATAVRGLRGAYEALAVP